MLPKSRVDGSECAPTLDDDTGNMYLLDDCLHSKARLHRCMQKACNMPQLFIDLGLFNNGDLTKAKPSRRWWLDLLHGQKGLLNNGRESYSLRSCDCLTKT